MFYFFFSFLFVGVNLLARFASSTISLLLQKFPFRIDMAINEKMPVTLAPFSFVFVLLGAQRNDEPTT